MYKYLKNLFLLAAIILGVTPFASAQRQLKYDGGEALIYVTPGEPTELVFPGEIAGGYLKKPSALRIDRKKSSLVLFSKENLDQTTGEAMLVKLRDERSFSLRIIRSSKNNARDSQVQIEDVRDGDQIINSESENEGDPTAPGEKKQIFAPATQVSGLMRQMVLAAEFGRPKISGYHINESYKGQPVLNDGTLSATIDRIYTGPKYWGYVLEVSNLLDQTQRINPGTFRLDGTRAVSAERWELAPLPLDAEQEVASRHKTKLYVITKAR